LKINLDLKNQVLRCLGNNDVESGVDRTSYVKTSTPLSPYTRLLKLKAQVDKSLGKKPSKVAINPKLANAPVQPRGLDTTDLSDKGYLNPCPSLPHSSTRIANFSPLPSRLCSSTSTLLFLDLI